MNSWYIANMTLTLLSIYILCFDTLFTIHVTVYLIYSIM
jgi:hypothetical protein